MQAYMLVRSLQIQRDSEKILLFSGEQGANKTTGRRGQLNERETLHDLRGRRQYKAFLSLQRFVPAGALGVGLARSASAGEKSK